MRFRTCAASRRKSPHAQWLRDVRKNRRSRSVASWFKSRNEVSYLDCVCGTAFIDLSDDQLIECSLHQIALNLKFEAWKTQVRPHSSSEWFSKGRSGRPVPVPIRKGFLHTMEIVCWEVGTAADLYLRLALQPAWRESVPPTYGTQNPGHASRFAALEPASREVKVLLKHDSYSAAGQPHYQDYLCR